MQGAAPVGTGEIIGINIVRRKLEFARQFGATHTINTTEEDVIKRVLELTEDEGVHYAFSISIALEN